MSLFTSAMFYRPGPPPVVTTSCLGDFIERVYSLPLREDDTLFSISLKYGKAIDQDDKPSSIREHVNDILSIIKPIDWDLDADGMQYQDIVEKLRNPVGPDRRGPTLYRADVYFGTLREDVCAPLCREVPEDHYDYDNDYLFLDSLMLSIGPVMLSDPNSATQYHVGWVQVSIGGNGLVGPGWTHDELYSRLRNHHELGSLCSVTISGRLRRNSRRPSRLPLVVRYPKNYGAAPTTNRHWTGDGVSLSRGRLTEGGLNA